MQEDLNFLLTNRIPRIALTRLMGWFIRIRRPLLARWSIAVGRSPGDYAFEMFDRIESSGAAGPGAASALKAKALQLTCGPGWQADVIEPQPANDHRVR